MREPACLEGSPAVQNKATKTSWNAEKLERKVLLAVCSTVVVCRAFVTELWKV